MGDSKKKLEELIATSMQEEDATRENGRVTYIIAKGDHITIATESGRVTQNTQLPEPEHHAEQKAGCEAHERQEQAMYAPGQEQPPLIANESPVAQYNSDRIEYITEQQAFTIKEMVHDLARIERLHARHPAGIPMLWGKLKRQLQITDYKMLPRSRYAEAVKILQEWQKTARDDSWRDPASLVDRSKIFRQCHGIANEYGIYDDMRAYMMRCWQADSMRTLENHQLQDLLRYMRSLEAAIKRKRLEPLQNQVPATQRQAEQQQPKDRERALSFWKRLQRFFTKS